MREILTPELVVSSWPFRTGTVVYDPIGGRDVATWMLNDLPAKLGTIQALTPVLNPFLPYTQRATSLLHLLEKDQTMLSDGLGVEGYHIHPLLSEDVEGELAVFAASHHLQLTDLSLAKLPKLLKSLSARSAEEHHALAADWWERYERPRSLQGASTFRTECGPGAGCYRKGPSGNDQAHALWKEAIHTPLHEFSLWTALHCHWGWREDFPTFPPPSFPAFRDIQRLFG